MNSKQEELAKQISINSIYVLCDIKIEEAREAKEKALKDKDLTEFTYQEGKLHCATQIKTFIENFIEELSK